MNADEVKTLITNGIELTNKTLTVHFEPVFDHLKDDMVMSNLDRLDMAQSIVDIRLHYLARGFGATKGSTLWLNDLASRLNLARSKNGFNMRLTRTNISKQESSYEEKNQGWKMGRKKKEAEAYY